MPDSTISPGLAPVRSRPASLGIVAPAERVGPRRRDVEWVDFTSDPDSAAGVAAPPAAKTPNTVRGAPGLAGALRHFARPSTPAAGAKDTIPGLARRFTRVPVGRLTPRQAPAPGARVSQPRPRGATTEPTPFGKVPVIVRPRVPAASSVTPRPTPVAPPRTIAQAEKDPFPAAISTPISAQPAAEPTPPRPWRSALAAACGATNGGLHAAATVASLAVARATTIRWRLSPRAARWASAWRGGAVGLRRAADRVGGFVAARENRLRVSGLLALMAVLIALAAYGGGVLLAAVMGPRAGVASAAPKPAAAGPSTSAVPTPAIAPTALSVPSNVPPGDPAPRAAFYMTRAKAGHPVAQYDVGVLYARGDGLVQDYASAFSWFHAAATQGNIAAQYNLGVLYAEGRGVPADQGEALNWYRSAADQNHSGAQFNLALAYAEGAGTTRDFAVAARWYERAARQGLGAAMINLAILYEQGNGVDRSPVEAYAWYSAAAERGDADAKQRTAALFQQFGDKDKARAQSLAATIGAALASASPKS